MIDYSELFEKSKQLAKESGLTQLELYQRFMFERILERISVSKYNENFILKGGLLLSAMLGINSRSTRDMDISIKGIDVSQENMLEILNEILSIDINDKVKFDVVNITDIRADDEYGGNKWSYSRKIRKFKSSIRNWYFYRRWNHSKWIKFWIIYLYLKIKRYIIDTYNIETILAEKIETILRRGKYNTRMKDYYDVYFFLMKLRNDIDLEIFKQALNNTLRKREAFDYYKCYKQILDLLLKMIELLIIGILIRRKTNMLRI